MSKASSSPPYQTEGYESFEDRLGSLFEELELAVHWQRPSILIAVYESEFIRAEAEAALTRQLSELGQQAAAFRVDAKNFDIPLILAQDPRRADSVFFVSGIRWGGGKGGYEAYRALNLHREHLVESQIRAVFWLTKNEANVLPRHAPDFWAFRHRVVEFTDPPHPARRKPSTRDLVWGGWKVATLSEDAGSKIALREAMLGRLPEGDESQAARVDLLYSLASLAWANGEYQKSCERLKQGLVIADRLQDSGLRARFWAGLGIVYHNLKQEDNALSAYKKAVELDPDDAVPWSNLAILYRDLNQPGQAIQACTTAIQLDPRNAGSWNNLGNVYRDLGRLEEAREAYRKAARFDPGDAKPWSNLGIVHRDLGRPLEAMRAFRKAARIDPSLVEPWRELGSLYQSLGRTRDAMKAYKSALLLDPDDAVSRKSLAACDQPANRKKS
jgi:Flp pilus assembly protein TadD